MALKFSAAAGSVQARANVSFHRRIVSVWQPVGWEAGHGKQERPEAQQEPADSDHLRLVGARTEVGDGQDQEAGGDVVTRGYQGGLAAWKAEPGVWSLRDFGRKLIKVMVLVRLSIYNLAYKML